MTCAEGPTPFMDQTLNKCSPQPRPSHQGLPSPASDPTSYPTGSWEAHRDTGSGPDIKAKGAPKTWQVHVKIFLGRNKNRKCLEERKRRAVAAGCQGRGWPRAGLVGARAKPEGEGGFAQTHRGWLGIGAEPTGGPLSERGPTQPQHPRGRPSTQSPCSYPLSPGLKCVNAEARSLPPPRLTLRESRAAGKGRVGAGGGGQMLGRASLSFCLP